MNRTPRPVAPAPNLANIPTELSARAQWVCWIYKWKQRKWTKIPITPGTTNFAKTDTPSTWRTYDEAVAAYLKPVGIQIDGIGYVFTADDPFVGGDRDHNLDKTGIPPTYAEISPSGEGIKFIGRATGTYGRKTAAGELYSSGRFFTITGNVLPGHETITDCQEAIEAFAASLGCSSAKSARGASRAGSGSRAELVKDIPESEWAAGRVLARTERESLVRRVKAAGGEETQLAVVLRGDYAAFHLRWPHVGLYRADGMLDDSQKRAVVAWGIKGRGFSFPEYAALMAILFGAEMVAKWGAGAKVREELAALWQKAPGPRFAPKAQRTPKRPLGRANIHAATVEQVYSLLIERRTETDAIIRTGDIARSIGIDRCTVTRILNELRDAGRISSRRLAGGGGLMVTFTPERDVIIPAAQEPESPAPEQANAPTVPTAEETRDKHPVFLQDRANGDHISETAHSDESPPALAELAQAYWSDTANGQRVNATTGEITKRRTAKHFAGLVTAEYPYTESDARAAYQVARRRLDRLEREMWQRFFAWLRGLTDQELITYIAGRARASLLGVVDHTEEQAPAINPFDAHLYATRLKCAKLQLSRRGLKMPARPTKEKPVKPRQRHAVAPIAPLLAVDQPSLFGDGPLPISEGWTLIEKLRARQGAAHVE